MKYYYRDQKLVEKRWFGNEYEDNFIEVKVLGETFYPSASGSTQYFLIELPDKTRKVVYYSNLFTSLQGKKAKE